MSIRQVFLDTETTGLKIEDNHRIIQIGCLEMIDRKLTGREFHYYLNPEREIEAGALAVHGITNDFLQDKPFFKNIADQFIDFVKQAQLIIHNAPFDVGFIDYELKLSQQGFKSLSTYCEIIDTLAMARSLHVGQRNSLDALCKRYGIDLTKRIFHGALLDAHLLAQVYLAMTGGQSDFFDILSEKITMKPVNANAQAQPFIHDDLMVLKPSEEELNNHEAYLQMLKQQGKCRWLGSEQ